MPEIQNIVVVGAGGFAREVRWIIEDLGRSGEPLRFAGFVVSDRQQLTDRDDVESIVGEIADAEARSLEVDGFALGIGDPTVRSRIGNQLSASMPQIPWPVLIHPSVQGDFGSWSLGKGVVVCAGVVGSVGIVLGDFAMVNINSTIGHDARIGEGTVVNPLASVSGGVEIGDRSLIGTGANILQYLTVGDDSVVGAGSVVYRDIPSGVTAIGMPARPIKTR